MSYTDIDRSSDYFETSLYTGTGSSLSISSLDFSPDLTWIKGRSGATEHVLTDSVRGVTKELSSNDSGAEETVAQGLTAFNSDGFTLGTDGSYNTSSATYAGWSWKAGGSASSNEDGSVTSSVSANTTAGFSIVKWTGTSADGTVGHGLGVAPKVVIVKSLGSTEPWYSYWQPLGNNKQVRLDATTASATTTLWLSTTPTSSVFSVLNHGSTNGSGDYIAYCFAEKQGFSKIGSYTGNGNADGTFVYLGFKPAWVLVKNTSGSGDNWILVDNKRLGYNPDNRLLFPNETNADYTDNNLDLLSNGFKARVSYDPNGSGNTMIYMAFAENPFVTSTGVPATAR